MLAKIKAKLLAAKDYVVVHWKQLTTSAVLGKYAAAIAGALSALVHKL